MASDPITTGTLRIKGMDWTVRLVPDLTGTRALHKADAWGECNYKDLTIDVLSSTALARRARVLFHEIAHAVLEQRHSGDDMEENEQDVLKCEEMFGALADNALLNAVEMRRLVSEPVKDAD